VCDHELSHQLPREIRAQVHGHQFVKLVLRAGVDAGELHITTTHAALAEEALGKGGRVRVVQEALGKGGRVRVVQEALGKGGRVRVVQEALGKGGRVRVVQIKCMVLVVEWC
jgi:hypothetical protein